MKNVCLECGTQLKGRLDKKFCDDQCRYLFNNKKKRQHEMGIINVNRILRKNRTILKSLNPIGKTTIRRTLLENTDFNFYFFTHQFRNDNGLLYYFIYEFGYAKLPDDKILLVTYQPYMSKKIHYLFKNQNE